MNRATRPTLALVSAVLLLAGGLAAQKIDSAQALLRAAMDKAVVDGDLNAAIAQYQTIVDKFTSDRSAVALALVRMAECYEKLGDTQARKMYERVVRDYTDQQDAVAVARARLETTGRAGRPGELTLRKVWTGNYFDNPAWRQLGTVSADGRQLSYSDEPFNTLFLHNPDDGSRRPLTARTRHDGGTSQQSAISRDGSQIAFNWLPSSGDVTCELRVASLKGNSVPQARRLFGSEDIVYITPMDWSPDAKWIAVTLRRRDRTSQIGLVSVPDGSLRVLKSVDWRGPTGLFFSPDGRDLLFDLPLSDDTDQRDVFVLAIDGSREIPAVTHPGNDIAMGWSPDGRQLLFASDRNGSNDLWRLPFSDRKPEGPGQLAKANIGNAWSMGITAAGALFMGVHAGDRDIEVASIDLHTEKVGGPVKPIQHFTGTNDQPAWSPDGKSLAYVSGRGPDGHLVIAIRSVETGDTRELQPKPVLPWFVGLSWAPDGRSFAVFGTDLKGRDGIFSLEAKTGRVVPLVVPHSFADRPSYEGFFWSPDQKRLYYHLQNGTILARDLASRQERILAPKSSPTDGRCGWISLSPDGQWIATCRSNASTKSQSLVLIPVDGGDRRELLRVMSPETAGNRFTWTPDGRGLLFARTSAYSADNPAEYHVTGLWLVPTTGGAPRKLDFDASRIYPYVAGKILLHPDGRQLAFVSGQRHAEIWVLENFLLTRQANARRR